METFTIKISTDYKIDKTWKQQTDRNNIIESIFDDFYVAENFYLKKGGDKIAELEYICSSRIDGYPIFKVHISPEQSLAFSELYYGSQKIDMNGISLVKTMKDHMLSGHV